ncbi:MAG: hypothetical protein OQJ89_03885 [Kangiellaceae bacterium]|nr:hypothetical protein [Kangiellaceae bacterium]MCW8997275.1 hypothetical protein [Kangiellaceae bacterium]MCW9016080.1 hypothetical protein [Kangiellaceae bacterium]
MKPKSVFYKFLAHSLATCLLLPVLTHAESNSLESYKHKILIGNSISSFNSNMRLDSELFDAGEYFDFEEDLKFDREVNLILGKYEIEFSTDHKFSFSLLPLHRDSFVTAEEELEIYGNTIVAGAEVYSKLDMTAYDLEYAYRLISSPAYNLELIAGIYWMDTKLSIQVDGRIQINEDEFNESASYHTSSRSGTPLPLFGVSQEVHFNDYWSVIASVRYFRSKHKRDEGEIISVLLATEYQWSKEIGFGVSYSFFDADVYLENAMLDIDSNIRWKYSGLNMYGFFRF